MSYHITPDMISTYDSLCAFTTIKIYEEEYLELNNSPLAAPLVLLNLDHMPAGKIEVNYKIDALPDVESKFFPIEE